MQYAPKRRDQIPSEPGSEHISPTQRNRRTARVRRKESQGNSYEEYPRRNYRNVSRRAFIPGMNEIESSNFFLASFYKHMDKIQPTADPSNGFGGLINMGLTCYGNAVIQNLRHLSKLVWIMEEGKYNTLFKKKPTERRKKLQDVTSAFAEIVQLIGKCKNGQSVRPGTFWKRVPGAVQDTLYEQLASKMCHDSHEFFLFLFEAVHEATSQDVDMRILRPPPTTPEEKLVHGALKAWQDTFTKEYSPLVHMFYGMFHQKTECQECKNVSHRWEAFNALKVPVPQEGANFNLMDALREDMVAEDIEEYVCEVCGPPRRAAKKTMSIWRMPLALVITLKRFTNDGKKIHTALAPLPAIIDFTPYFSKESPEILGETRYTLRGMVDHHGPPSFGHYTAQCRHLGNDKWYTYDDENTRDMSGAYFGRSNYMLFLERHMGS
jgi:ubiquitin C-terminal hydrolase